MIYCVKELYKNYSKITKKKKTLAIKQISLKIENNGINNRQFHTNDCKTRPLLRLQNSVGKQQQQKRTTDIYTRFRAIYLPNNC